MKVINIVSSIDKSSGGPARSVTHLIESILRAEEGVEIELNTIKTSHPIIERFKSKSGRINFHTQNSFFGFSKFLEKSLGDSKSHLFHGHGLWELPVNHMARFARKKKVPYIIAPRGMLEPWSLEQGKIKKRIALKLFQFNDLKNAACLHATAPMEVESIRKLGLKNPIAMIPNGIDLMDFPSEPPLKLNRPKKILFLSRIHPKKGIENLIQAWRLMDEEIRNDWVVEIIGNGERKYIRELQNQINNSQLQEQIFIKNPIFGRDKIIAFREASLFVLPTFSENFGIVIAEALASYTPVITTKGAPWSDLNTHDCGWWIDIGVDPLKKSLEDAMKTPSEKLAIMGNRGRQLIEEKYGMESVAKQMMELYKWILTKKNKPNFVDIL